LYEAQADATACVPALLVADKRGSGIPNSVRVLRRRPAHRLHYVRYRTYCIEFPAFHRHGGMHS
jgi:hypothetical protein